MTSLWSHLESAAPRPKGTTSTVGVAGGASQSIICGGTHPSFGQHLARCSGLRLAGRQGAPMRRSSAAAAGPNQQTHHIHVVLRGVYGSSVLLTEFEGIDRHPGSPCKLARCRMWYVSASARDMT